MLARLLLPARLPQAQRRRARLSSGPAGSEGPPKKDAFRKGLPFLFRNNATLGTLVSLLVIVYLFNGYSDLTTPPEPHDGGATALDDGVEKVLPDGRMLMQDGSIRRKT